MWIIWGGARRGGLPPTCLPVGRLDVIEMLWEKEEEEERGGKMNEEQGGKKDETSDEE